MYNPFRDIDYEELIKERDYYKSLAEGNLQEIDELEHELRSLKAVVESLEEDHENFVPRKTPICPSCKTRDAVSLSNGTYTTHCAYCTSD